MRSQSLPPFGLSGAEGIPFCYKRIAFIAFQRIARPCVREHLRDGPLFLWHRHLPVLEEAGGNRIIRDFPSAFISLSVLMMYYPSKAPRVVDIALIWVSAWVKLRHLHRY